jgi:hypothetical protein
MSQVATCICPRCRVRIAASHLACPHCRLSFDPASLAAFYYYQAPTRPGLVIMQSEDIRGAIDGNLRSRFRRLFAAHKPARRLYQ